MPRHPLEVEVDRVEAELSATVDPREGRAEPLIRSRQGSEEVFVPQTRYRFNYRNPERFTADETRRRRYETFLVAERERLSQVEFARRAGSKAQAQAAAADARAYHPSGRVRFNPRTIFGTEAYTFYRNGLRQHLLSPVLAIPCIQRVVRREVMFAERKAGRGYRVPHVRSILSNIGC